jgi:hypothetical protein
MLLVEGVMMSRSRLHMAWISAALLLALAVRGDSVTLFARCGPDCEPSPASFTVPAGREAAHFRVLDLRAGRYCSNSEGRSLSGFCIRRGGHTVFVYYQRAQGPVSDPVPLGDLVLSEGRYKLLAAPAKEASVRLAFDLREESRPQ